MSPMKLVGDWRKAISVTGAMAASVDLVIDQTVSQEAALYRVMVDKAFKEGGPPGGKWLKLKPSTIARRRAGRVKTTKPLIATGSLRGSVNVRRAAAATYFVGVSRSVRRKGGGPPMVNIARVHEVGALVPSKSGARYFLIPQRSFLDSTFRKFKQGAEARAMARFSANLMIASGAT